MTRSNLCVATFAKDVVFPSIIAQDFSNVTGVRIGEASNPGPRLRRRGPRSLDSRAAHLNRGGLLALEAPESHDDKSSEKCVTLL